MTNFDFLKSDPQFSTFSDVAISAEKILNIDAAASVLNCRRAMEFAVKWMYSEKRLFTQYPNAIFLVDTFTLLCCFNCLVNPTRMIYRLSACTFGHATADKRIPIRKRTAKHFLLLVRIIALSFPVAVNALFLFYQKADATKRLFSHEKTHRYNL